MKAYDVLVYWYTWYERARLSYHSKWHRGVQAGSLTQACDKALAHHTNEVLPSVSMCWPQFPQPRRLS